jgi:hypothetical protein
MAAAMVMAKAIKMRIGFPRFAGTNPTANFSGHFQLQ